MSHPMLPSILALVGTLVGGGLIGAVLNHLRLAPRSVAETINMDWERFQAEIKRLDTKVTAQAQRIDGLEREVRDCHREKAKMEEEFRRDKSELEAKFLKLKAVVEGRGEIHQMAQQVVSADRVAERAARRPRVRKGSEPK